MHGPSSPNHRLGADGPPHTDTHPSQAIPTPPSYFPDPAGDAAPPSAAYPGSLPPPVQYPKRRRAPLIVSFLAALVLIGALISAILHGSHAGPATAGAFSDATATAAIQGYLDALEHRDNETIERNTLCGIYDAVRDRRTDRALAKLSSEAFRKQFAEARVTSIDKIVYWSQYQAQVLFSMRVQPAGYGTARQNVQGIAQLLRQQDQVLVCSYVLRTGGSY